MGDGNQRLQMANGAQNWEYSSNNNELSLPMIFTHPNQNELHKLKPPYFDASYKYHIGNTRQGY